MSITQELNAGIDRFQGESCDGCGKYYKQRLSLFQEPGWGAMYVLCKKCIKVKRQYKLGKIADIEAKVHMLLSNERLK